MSLRNKIIRLAHAKPELRKHLLPLLKKKADPFKDYLEGEKGNLEIMWHPQKKDLQIGIYGEWWSLGRGKTLMRGKNLLLKDGIGEDPEYPPMSVQYKHPHIVVEVSSPIFSEKEKVNLDSLK